jgi:hypothetical protein
MPTTNSTEAEYLLRKALTTEGADLVLDHPWVWEVDRWKELVFALITHVVSLPEHEVRDLVNDLEDLGLLDVSTLAGLQEKGDTPESRSPYEQRILQLLTEKGVGEADARRGLTTISEVAVGLDKYYSGKVQRYLRHYGELMLRELQQVFRFSALGEIEVTRAFTYWLQNVLNMPVSLADDSVKAFCEEHQLTPDEIFEAADGLNLNLALVDDLVQRQIERQGSASVQAGDRAGVVHGADR